jgi:hypothetical protein
VGGRICEGESFTPKCKFEGLGRSVGVLSVMACLRHLTNGSNVLEKNSEFENRTKCDRRLLRA